MPGGLMKMDTRSRAHHMMVIRRKRISKYLRARTVKRLYGETWGDQYGEQEGNRFATHCRIIWTEIAVTGPLGREQSSPFISLRSPCVWLVVGRGSVGLVLFALVTLVTIL